ncbi:MAG: metal-dependent hydrolase, partial [Actinobacteria bacterium]|nr:metal-dependent hydrolase [Actinomycetota bacterium]
MVIGASTWLALQALAGPLTASELSPREQAYGAVIAAGGALLCDLDTPDSRLAHSLGALTKLVARAIGRVFGGHRVGTHSLAFCALVGALSTLALTQREVVRLSAGVTLSAGQLVALLIAYASAALTVALLLAVRGARPAVISAALVAVAASTQPPPALVSAALTIGCASHLLADLLTPEGIAPLWPFSGRRVSLGLIRRTGDRRETLLVLATALVTLAT